MPPSFLASFLALSMEVTTEPLPDISERSPISLRTRARARWGADAGYDQFGSRLLEPTRSLMRAATARCRAGIFGSGVRGAPPLPSVRFCAPNSDILRF